MDQKEKALKVALSFLGVMALAMFSYYWFSSRNRTTENDLNMQEKVEAVKEEKSEFAGVYSGSEPVEGLNHRLGFFSVSRKEDGGSYFGTAKLDAVAAAVESSVFMKCNDVTLGEKDFFIKCADPNLGQISFNGEWQKSGTGIEVNGKLLWTKDGAEVLSRSLRLTRSPN